MDQRTKSIAPRLLLGLSALVLGTGDRCTIGPEMVYVAEGDFTMGSNLYYTEAPIHTAHLSAYWIDRTEVTVDSYATCVADGACPTPFMDSFCNASRADRGDHPANCIDWNRARQYCSWAGKRLPTEAEWEKAARGGDARTYPWGEMAPSCTYANVAGCLGHTAAVGSYPAGASPYGALDMTGDVWEWVNDWFDPAYYSVSPATNPQGPASGTSKVLRGGSWFLPSDNLRASGRVSLPPYGWGNGNIGFRCAHDG